MFNEDLYYEKTRTSGQGCYNGNISQSSIAYLFGDLSSDDWYTQENFDYSIQNSSHAYDQLSRLTNTTTSGGSSTYNEAMTYDKHGNIGTINRSGIYQLGLDNNYPNHTYGVIDNVTLSYEGNQLNNAIDEASDPSYLGSQDFKNYMTTYPGTEYHFDANGNLLDDYNKGIVTIRSNFLNLPDTVQMENGDMASFSYSPSGDKFMCIYSTANTSTVTMPLGTTLSNGRPAGITVAQNLFMLYMDNVVYEGNPWSTTLHNLSKVITDDGILVRTNSVTESTPVFERNYYVRDHLGNVRVVFDSQGRVRQLNNYTPFGMEYGESAGNQASVGYQDYKFGGKELDRRFELKWYNFGARMYDPSLGRWTTIDQLCENVGQESVTPYGYVFNNPNKHNDPDGRFPLLSNLVGAAVGALIEYGGQVAANVYENGWSTSAFTDNIDFGDIGLAAGEGFLTSGSSIAKNAFVKTTVAVGSEVARNYVDVKTSSDGTGLNINTNDAGKTVKKILQSDLQWVKLGASYQPPR